MASLRRQGGNYLLIWTDNSRTPSQVSESLKTKKQAVAKRRKAKLESQYYELDSDGTRKHDPWKRKWYKSEKQVPLLVGPLVEQFIIFKSKARGQQGWSDSVQRRETYVMRKFAEICGKGREIAGITPEDLERFYYRQGVTSDHTRKGNYISVNTFLNWCLKNEYLKTKPEFKPKRPQSKIPKFMYPAEIGELINYRMGKVRADIISSRLKQTEKTGRWMMLCWLVMAGTGIRRKELCHLKRSHVERGSILIGADFTTKVRAERRIPLLFESRWAVHQLLEIDSGSQFLTGKKPNYAQQKLTNIFSECWQGRFPGKPKRTLYGLKDSFCIRFLSADLPDYRQGMKINDLKEILGHASLKTTEKYLKAINPGTVVDGSVWDVVRSEELANF